MSAERLPIYVAAGVNKLETQILHTAQEETLAAQTLGSYTDLEWFGNSQGGRKNVFHWDPATMAAYNSIGLENPGRKNASLYLPRAIRAMHDQGQTAVISVSTLVGEDPMKVLPDMAEWGFEMGADQVEVNGSCPNQGPEHPLLCFDVDASYMVIDAVRDRVGQGAHLRYKVSPLSAETIRRYNEDRRLAVDSIGTINTKGSQMSPINPRTGKPYIETNEGRAGQSGPIIRDLARDNLFFWSTEGVVVDEEPPYELWSTGGVDTHADAGYEIHDRVTQLGATMVGGAQEFYRASDPRRVAARWAQQYLEIAA